MVINNDEIDSLNWLKLKIKGFSLSARRSEII